jgi:hypothetical protein
MLEAMATLILVIVGAVLIIFVLGYGIYITFYPLSKTVKGGIEAMKEHGALKEEEAPTIEVREGDQSQVPTTKQHPPSRKGHKEKAKSKEV